MLVSQSPAVAILGTGTGALLHGKVHGSDTQYDLTDPDGNATPSFPQFIDGTVTATFNVGPNNNEDAHNLFENSVGGGANKWCCSGPTQSATIQLGVGPQTVDRFTITSGNDAADRDPLDWQILGSNDGVDFNHPIFTKTGAKDWTARNQVLLYERGVDGGFSGDLTPYEYLRFEVTSTVNGFQLNELEFFSDAFNQNPIFPPPPPVPPGTVISDLIGGDLTDPENNGDDSLTYDPGSGQLAGFDAIFTSTDEPGFGGGEFSFNVFDNEKGGGNNKWCCNDPGADGHQLDAEILADDGKAHFLTHFTLTSSNDSPGRDPLIFSIEGSNDGSDFDVLFSYDGIGGPIWSARNQTVLFQAGIDFPIPTEPYKVFRYNVLDTVDSSHALGEIEYFGIPVPEPSTLLLAVLGGLALVLFRRKRSRAPRP
jgi:hypothetical protein